MDKRSYPRMERIKRRENLAKERNKTIWRDIKPKHKA